MGKYNTYVKTEKPAAYRMAIRPELIDEIYEQVLRKMIVDKRYRDPDFRAKTLAEEIGTNTRYISATMSLRFHMSFSELISGYRVRDAISMITDKRYKGVTMSEIGAMCGFANRQSFYAAFFHFEGKTPKQYQVDFYNKTTKK